MDEIIKGEKNSLPEKVTIVYENDSEYTVNMVKTIEDNIGIHIGKLKESDIEQGIYGKLLRDKENDKISILINPSLSPEIKRFTLAHELGHAYRHFQSELYLNEDTYIDYTEFNSNISKSYTKYIIEEEEANEFARQVLLPRDKLFQYLADYIQNKKNTKEFIKNCAQDFGLDYYFIKRYLEYMNLKGIYLDT